MHIPKTAGMSLQGLVRRRYKKAGSLALIYSQKEVEQGFEDHPELETVMGHYRFGFHKFSQRQPRYFTFLREPIQQVISHYYYSLEHPQKFPDLPGGIENVIDFAYCRYGYNLQTRFVSGMDDIRGKEDLALHEARHNLTQHFEMVGITEQFDKSLLLLGRHFNWKTLFYLKGNRGNKKSESLGVSAEEIRKLESILAPDIKLYQIGLELFKIECSKVDDLNLNLRLFKIGNRIFKVECRKMDDLNLNLRFFKLGNRIFKGLNPTYIRLKKLLGKDIQDPHS